MGEPPEAPDAVTHDHAAEVPYVRAETREDVLVAKEGALFACARPSGDIAPGPASSLGLYSSDTRHLSELTVTLGGRAPVVLSSSDADGYHVVVEATNADLHPGPPGREVSQQTVSLRRELLIADGTLYARLRLRGFASHPLRLTLEAVLAADFADMFDVRGAAEQRDRNQVEAGADPDGTLRFAYTGDDGRERTTLAAFAPAPASVDELGEGRFRARWSLELHAGGRDDVLIVVSPGATTGREPSTFDDALASVRGSHRRWAESCTSLLTTNERVEPVLAASVRDLRALLTPVEDVEGMSGEMVAAGIPWYVAPFGRDSLITGYASLAVEPGLARRTLLLLAALQAREDDPWRDAEPGKILHEIRAGELAAAGLIPHTPYYGSADSTPLFVMLAGAHHRWTGDEETLHALRPALDAALEWIDRHGDRDGDGFVEYERRSPGGLLNQGWKDSNDPIVHADGRLAEGPVALVEVQAYVYRAKRAAADLYDELGEPDRARSLRAEADTLRQAIVDAFWDEREGTLALALDGRKRQVASVTSNAGHCLFCGVLDDRRAAAVVERLMAPDMFSGWGIRTLARTNPAYNPMSYHCGSIWPHDNAIIAAGFKRYGFTAETDAVASALFDVARLAEDSRLPELYCGFGRDAGGPVSYPVACSPQAWAAAAPFLLLQAMLGLSADVPNGVLAVHRPTLPAWLDEVELRGLRVGRAQVGLRFHREGDATSFTLLDAPDDVRVTMTG